MEKYPEDEIIFANGGDREEDTTPEHKRFSSKDRLSFAYNVGDEKKYGSRDFLASWVNNKEERPWGYFKILYRDDGVKVKEIVIAPGKSMSFQKHNLRSELWFVTKGKLAKTAKNFFLTIICSTLTVTYCVASYRRFLSNSF